MTDPDLPADARQTSTRRLSGTVQSLRDLPHLGIWIGVVLVAAGGALLVLAWNKTAALTNVSLQIPYVMSAGFTGLGLVAVGLTIVNVSVKLEDARERTRQTEEMVAMLSELRRVIEQEATE